MQHSYVADIGDYTKFAILRALSPGRKLGVAWWMFAGKEKSGDGGHREYLCREKEWKHFDPELFAVLLKIKNDKNFNIQAIEEAGVLSNAVFASGPVPCVERPFSVRPAKRREWFLGVKAKLKDCNLIFVDPDNGIGPEGLRLTRRSAGKSVTIAEIKELHEKHRTIVVYHHQSRYPGGHAAEIRNLTARLMEEGLQVSGVLRAKPWSPRIFLIINGDENIQRQAMSLAKRWGDWIGWYPGEEVAKTLI